MNWSAALVAEVPPGPTTVTSTVPVPAGEVAVIWVSLSTVIAVAAVVPKFTAVAPVNRLPVTVTLSPPAAAPFVGLMPLTSGDEVLPLALRFNVPRDESSLVS